MAGELAAMFAQAEQQYGLPAGYLARTAQIESGGNPLARNPNSSAGGLFQFIDSTARQYGLTDRFDPVAATDAAARLARDNAALLQKRIGRAPTAAELYLAHQQGAGGAAALLANPGAPVASVVGAPAAALNGGTSGQTAGDFAAQWLGKFNGQPQRVTVGPGAAPSLAEIAPQAMAIVTRPQTAGAPGDRAAAPALSNLAAMFLQNQQAAQQEREAVEAERQARRIALLTG